jgi:imidazole glycerol-phosphate synthase subunit HisH
MIGIIDYGMGNLLSVYNAFDYLGEDVEICNDPNTLNKYDRIVIPGVGAFKKCIESLKNKGFIEALNKETIINKKPTLGICLGMQVMCTESQEFGFHYGLGWFNATVKKIDTRLNLPVIGWNEINQKKKSPLFNGIPDFSDFYLVHSFYAECLESDLLATYQIEDTIITAALINENIVATQFHPEKSQDYGLKFLENFIAWNPLLND